MTPPSPPTLSLLAAVAANGVIGKDNALPWQLPADLKRFKALTLGHPIIMGRKTFEAIGRALPGRHNIVVTRQPDYSAPGCTVAASLATALACARDAEELFVIGGGELYRAALPLADRLYITEIAAAFEGNARFPDYDRTAWREVSREHQAPGAAAPFAFDFVRYERRS
jgi:dihydrofolate reductase